jgi:hypothetical protein
MEGLLYALFPSPTLKRSVTFRGHICKGVNRCHAASMLEASHWGESRMRVQSLAAVGAPARCSEERSIRAQRVEIASAEKQNFRFKISSGAGPAGCVLHLVDV